MRWPWGMMRRQWTEVPVRTPHVDVGPRPCPSLLSPRAADQRRPVGRMELRQMAEELSDESAAYLAGTYAETLGSRCRVVPAWAWTNLLAHGSAPQLRLQAQALDRGLLHARAWLAARAYLAAEIVERVDRGASLTRLQREVLIPLELALVTRAEGAPARLTVTEWVAAVRKALATHDAPAARSATGSGA